MIGLTVHIGFAQVASQSFLDIPQTEFLPTSVVRLDYVPRADRMTASEAVDLPVQSGPPVVLGGSANWLAITLDANQEDRFIQEQLGRIGLGLTNAFNFVRDEIGYEAYTGSLRGARGALWSEAGNSLDQASLLIALLRAQGIGARYVHGTLSTNDARSLIRSMFDPVVAANAVGYIPDRYPVYDPEADPGLLRSSMDHWWVELENGTQLDPTYPGMRVGQTLGAAVGRFFEVPDDLRHKVVLRLKTEFFAMLLGLYEETALETTFATPEIYGKALTLGHFVSAYQPPALIGGYKTYTYSPYLMVDDNDSSLENNHLIRGKDYQELFSSLLAIVNTTLTRLTLEMEVRAPGREPELRTRDLLDRVGIAARHGLGASLSIDNSQPAFTENDLTTILVTPGFVRAEMITPWQDALKAISPQTEALAAKLAPLTNGASVSPTAEMQADAGRYGLLNRWAAIAGGSVVAGAFLLDSDIYLRQMRDAHRTRAYYDSPRLTLFETRTTGQDTNATVRFGLDLRRNVVQAVPYPGQNALTFFAFNLVKGRVDSILEHLTVQDFLGSTNSVGPASPIAVFEAAKAQNIPLAALACEADIPGRLEGLPISAEAKARIGLALRSGRQVNVPVQMVSVNGVPSIGWWETDTQTGETVAVSEGGGNQEAVEFVIISVLIVLSALLVVFIFGGKINEFFSKSGSQTQTVNLSNITPHTKYGDAAASAQKQPSILVDKNNEQLRAFQTSTSLDATGGDGSIIDYAGTDVEVIFTYLPGTNTQSGPTLIGNGLKLETVAEPGFVVKAGENQIPSAYRARITNTGTNAAGFELNGTPPAGWNLLLARTNSTIPTNATGGLSVFLQPQTATPMPAPGTDLSFALAVARSGSPSTTLTQALHFVMPVVQGFALRVEPETLYVSPNGSVTNALHLFNAGNVTQSVVLTLDAPTNFLTAGLVSSLVLGPGQSVTQALQYTAQGIAPDTDFHATITATYGETNSLQKEASMRLHVAAPGALQALNAANDAKAIHRNALAATLEVLGQDLSRLYNDLPSEVLKSRVLAALVCLVQELDDPLLTPFATNLASAHASISASSPATLATALESLGVEMSAFAERLKLFAEHDFELALRPNAAPTLPETPTKFGLYLKNKGSKATTYSLSLSDMPAGIIGGLNTNRITLPPGGETSPTLEVDQKAWVTLTQPTNQLTAFEFTVTASAEGSPEIARSAVGAFTAREELVKVLSVEASPPFIRPLETKTDISTFTGGDVGEGLDLDGHFVYAVNLGAAVAVGQIRDAVFTNSKAAGILAESWYEAGNWHSPVYGSSTNDDRLEVVMQSIQWSTRPGTVQLSLANLILGQPYKLQLLFTEQSNIQRKFDVLVEGKVIAATLHPAGILGGAVNTTRGVVVTHRFVAADAVLQILISGQNTGYDPVLSGATLEEEARPAVEVSARVFNAANAVREVLLSYTVKDSSNETVFASTPVSGRLSVLTSVDTFGLGAMDTTSFSPGIYTIEAQVTETDGTPIPSAQGRGELLVGLPVSAAMAAVPTALPAGGGQVEVVLDLSSQATYDAEEIALVGMVDTPGDGFSVAVRGQYAYVGGPQNISVVDISDARNPRLDYTFGAGQRVSLTPEHLLVQKDQKLEVYTLTNPARPSLIGSAASGVSGTTYANQVQAWGNHGFVHVLTFGWDNWGSPLFVRGDVTLYDISNPANPVSQGLLYNTTHPSYPQYPGSDYFFGLRSDIKDGIVLVPSSSAVFTGTGGTGRLRLLDARETNKPSILGSFDVPGTAILTAIAVQGDRALVTGSRSPFVYKDVFLLTGSPTLALLDFTNAAAPSLLGPVVDLSTLDDRPYGDDHVFAARNGFYFVGNQKSAGKPVLVLVDTRDVSNIVTHLIDVPTAVTDGAMDGRFFYTASSSGLGVYDLGALLVNPVTARVRVPNDGRTTIVPGSFNVPPNETIPGSSYDTLVWRFAFSPSMTNQQIAWRSSLTNLPPGEAREVVSGTTVEFVAWGSSNSLDLPPITVAAEHFVTLAPGTQTVRPGEVASCRLTVTNGTAAPLRYSFRVRGVPVSWVSLTPEITVPGESQAGTDLVLRADSTAALGDYGFGVDVKTVEGASDSVQGCLTLAGAPLVDSVTHGVVVSLSPSQSSAGQGTPAQFTARLVNTGNARDEYALSAQMAAGFAAQFSSSSVEVLPGQDNYREVLLRVVPQPGTVAGDHLFTVTATSTVDSSVACQVTGTVHVASAGVALGWSPGTGVPGSTFALMITNTGQQTQTFDLALGGAAAGSASLSSSAVTLAPQARQSLFVTVSNLDYCQPGSLPLIALATMRGNTNVQARAAATVEMPAVHGLTAVFAPPMVGVPLPGQASALLVLRNTGNTEDAYTARITEVVGALTASLVGATNQPVQETGALRLPGLASGAVLLRVAMTQPGTGALHVAVSSLRDSNLVAQAVLEVRCGVWLGMKENWVMELSFEAQTGMNYFLEYRDGVAPGQQWQELPGGPFNRGIYYLCLPWNCARFNLTFPDPQGLFVDYGTWPEREYRLRTTSGVAPRLFARIMRASMLEFSPLPGFDHTVQYADGLTSNIWYNLPRSPHNAGLAFDPRVHTCRFYRVLIEPQETGIQP